MQMNPVGWFEIYVDDMSRAKAFYEAVFETSLEKLDGDAKMEIEMWLFPSSMEQYGAAGALAKMEGVSPGGNSTLVYFSCQDCANEQSRVEGAGGKVVHPKFAIGPHGFISMVSDTEGNMIGLHSME
ncbi:VOC family protein [Vibrio europaeus]|uniref:Lactoylglutathione lyase n=3 Tax=Vibrio oreintalis group TaxID=1891919 RepID=A0A178J5L9_9VIBR|nr:MULTISPECIES: VOC family protein [Vibrio oreintalis group]AIW16935.1 lactoylglutathione lyase [Vibrio tubiashii ATCC 19109]EIF04680.1 glyoxalase family protein [Vibrio tubiashii NCIMB 1337 = ATCC 19106]MDC5705840.1 VOC family protein [Vibrio europaeus]MDC5709250.1 VOC family protein [Vibrio europaeus]MDC5713649.1 VOC family protein [Vibrio europaeus]